MMIKVCSAAGGIDTLECMAPSWSGRVAVASTLVGTLGVTRMLRYCADHGTIVQL